MFSMPDGDWAYTVNLDDEVFEVCRCWPERPHSGGRYAHLGVKRLGESVKYPPDLLREWPLSQLPDSDTFLQELTDADPRAGNYG